ncbi:MAG: Flp family type IVb pilin [Pseudomonadota bacterium]
MGETKRSDVVSDAARRYSVDGAVARLSLTIRRFAADKSGATALEYSLLAALLGLFLLGASGSVSTAMSTTFNLVTTDLSSALN